MYFTDRTEAGKKLAAELTAYRYENCAVVALGDGAVLIGEEIAAQLHCVLTMLLTEDIGIPGENAVIGSVDEKGGFSYNQAFSTGEIDEYYTEYHGYIEDQKREKFAKINRLLGADGLMDPDLLRDHIIVLVSDGLKDSVVLDAAAEFFKSLRIDKMVVVAPIASVQAVDRMHTMADELHVLSVTENYIDTNHYYDFNNLPSHEDTVKKINEIILKWR